MRSEMRFRPAASFIIIDIGERVKERSSDLSFT